MSTTVLPSRLPLADQLKLPIAALAGEYLRLAPLNLPSEFPI